MAGIYRIKNVVTIRSYFGATKQKFEARWQQHRSALRLNFHHNPLLQADYNRQGIEGFVFEEWELEEAIPVYHFRWHLNDREKYWRVAFQLRNLPLYNPPVKSYWYLEQMYPMDWEEIVPKNRNEPK